jgi:mono/diheme cytochrome c family protein
MKQTDRRTAAYWVLALGAALVVGACAPMPEAQAPQPAAEADLRSVRDGVFTTTQATRGQTSFQQSCAACHSVSEFSGPGFQRIWSGQTIGHIHAQIAATMPLDSPGSLSPQTYTDIITYFLRENGYPTGAQELAPDSASLFSVRMEPVADD